jgi:transposase
MAVWRRAIELSLGDTDLEKLRSIAQSRTEPASRVERALGGSSRRAGESAAAMITLPAGVRVWLATGHTDMRKGFPSLALQVQEILHREPLSGHLFCFRPSLAWR